MYEKLQRLQGQQPDGGFLCHSSRNVSAMKDQYASILSLDANSNYSRQPFGKVLQHKSYLFSYVLAIFGSEKDRIRDRTGSRPDRTGFEQAEDQITNLHFNVGRTDPIHKTDDKRSALQERSDRPATQERSKMVGSIFRQKNGSKRSRSVPRPIRIRDQDRTGPLSTPDPTDRKNIAVFMTFRQIFNTI